MGAKECQKAHIIKQTSQKRFIGRQKFASERELKSGNCNGGNLTKHGDCGNASHFVSGNDMFTGAVSLRQTGEAPGP